MVKAIWFKQKKLRLLLALENAILKLVQDGRKV